MEHATARLVFREASDTRELEALLRLRNRTYAESRYAEFLPMGRPGFTLDGYDLKAWHFGLFLENGAETAPVGYLRVVDRLGVADARMHRIAWTHREEFANLRNEPACPLPVTDYWPRRESLRAAYVAAAGPGSRVVEASQLTLAPECRSHRTARSLIEGALSICFYAYRVEAIFMAASESEYALYEPVGFTRIEGTTQSPCRSVSRECVCMVATPRSVPAGIAADLRVHAEEFRERRSIGFEEPLAARQIA